MKILNVCKTCGGKILSNGECAYCGNKYEIDSSIDSYINADGKIVRATAVSFGVWEHFVDRTNLRKVMGV